MAVTRYAVGLPALTDAGTEHVIAWVAPTLQRYLTGPAPAPATGSTPASLVNGPRPLSEAEGEDRR